MCVEILDITISLRSGCAAHHSYLNIGTLRSWRRVGKSSGVLNRNPCTCPRAIWHIFWTITIVHNFLSCHAFLTRCSFRALQIYSWKFFHREVARSESVKLSTDGYRPSNHKHALSVLCVIYYYIYFTLRASPACSTSFRSSICESSERKN